MWSQFNPALWRSGIGNVFIKILNNGVDNKILFDIYTVFGNILSCEIATGGWSISKGYGYVHFLTEEAALNAIYHVNGRWLHNRQMYVSKFIPRKEREKEQRGEYQSIAEYQDKRGLHYHASL